MDILFYAICGISLYLVVHGIGPGGLNRKSTSILALSLFLGGPIGTFLIGWVSMPLFWILPFLVFIMFKRTVRDGEIVPRDF